VDPSIAAAALEADEGTLLADLSSLGTLFESLCVRDLRVYAEALGGRLYRYHDSTGLEADAVMTVRDGRYALMEVKLGSTEIDDGARSLLTLADRIDQRVMGAPAFCAVITPGGYAYARNDGVLVLPITCLAP
jgi:predicted AAA+ superfamily ATPase